MTLYKLSAEALELLDLMEDPDIDPQVLTDTLEAVMAEIDMKVDDYCTVINHLSAKMDQIDKEAKRLTTWKQSISGNIKRMKETLMGAMDATGRKKIETEHYRIGIQKNGGVQPMTITGDVPEEYCKLEPDNAKIREALDKGAELDFAHFEERGRSLRIR